MQIQGQPREGQAALNRDLLVEAENFDPNGHQQDQAEEQRIILTREDLEGNVEYWQTSQNVDPIAKRGKKTSAPTAATRNAKIPQQQSTRSQRSQPRGAPQGGSRSRVQQYQQQLREQRASQGKALPTYLRNVQSKERGLISRDRQIALQGNRT